MMKLMSMKQYMGMSKPALIRKITKTLRAMPKVKLARLCYNITKSKLPRVSIMARKRKGHALIPTEDAIMARILSGGWNAPRDYRNPYEEQKRKKKREEQRRKKKRKFSRKQLAAQRLFAKRARAGTLKRRRR